MIQDVTAEGSETAADRLARLVRALGPASLQLPEDDGEALRILRDKLQGVLG